jgi:hypothetical protein
MRDRYWIQAFVAFAMLAFAAIYFAWLLALR